MSDIDTSVDGAPRSAKRSLGVELYAPKGPNGRLTYGWATILLQPAIYLLAGTLALIAAVATVSGPRGLSLEEAIIDPWFLIVTIVVQFPAWLALNLLWVRAFERRPFGSIGLRRSGAAGTYLKGVAAGFGVALLLAVVSPFVAPAGEMEAIEADFARVLSLDWGIVLAAAAAIFLFQSACEEIVFRGWMLSTLAARWGAPAGVIVNSAVFGILHVNLLYAPLLAGLLGVSAIMFVGVFFSLWAVAQRTVVGVCGAHGGFNATLVVFGSIGAAATHPEASPLEALSLTIADATSVAGEGGAAGAAVQLVVFVGLSLLVWRGAQRALARDREA